MPRFISVRPGADLARLREHSRDLGIRNSDFVPSQVYPDFEGVRLVGREAVAVGLGAMAGADRAMNSVILRDNYPAAFPYLDMNREQWDAIEPAVLPQNEDEQAIFLQRISQSDWTSITSDQAALLKAFVVRARKEFPQFLTDDVLDGALRDFVDGVFELVKRSHPYTLQVLRAPEQFTHHFRRHEGQYYRLFALKLLGKLSQPALVVNVDPHPDMAGGDGTLDQWIGKSNGDTTFETLGAADYNWASAVIRDDLAKAVIMAYAPPQQRMVKWHFLLLRKDENGEISFWRFEKPADFKAVRSELRKVFSFYSLHWSVDLDTFALRHEKGMDPPVFHPAEEIPDQLKHLLGEADSGSDAVSLTTADSRRYLQPKADEFWINQARVNVQKAFKENILKSDSGSDSALAFTKGGIDLSADTLDLEVRKQGGGPTEFSDPITSRPISGLIPVIVSLRPCGDLKDFIAGK